MKTQCIATSLCLIGFMFSASADIFVMKDGTELEGTIIRKDDTTYLLEVNITKSIKDERLVQRADVVRIKKEKHDLAAFEELEKLMPTPDYLTEADYADRIKEVEKFLKEHRSSAKARDAKKMLATLQEEAKEIAAGGIKSGGKLISAADYRANAVDLDASAMAEKIKALVEARQFLPALRSFHVMTEELDKTNAYTDLVPLMQRVIKSHLAEVQRLADSYDARMEKREIGLSRMKSRDRRATEAALQEQEEMLATRLTKEKAAKVGWVTPSADYKESLTDTLSFGQAEASRLKNAQKSDNSTDIGKIYRDAMRQIKAGAEPAEANAAISGARSAGIPDRYIDMLEAVAPKKK